MRIKQTRLAATVAHTVVGAYDVFTGECWAL